MDKAFDQLRKGLKASINIHPDPFLKILDAEAERVSAEGKADSAFDLKIPYGSWDVEDKRCNRLKRSKKRPTHSASLNFEKSVTKALTKRRIKVWRKVKDAVCEVEEEIDADAPIIDVALRFEKEKPAEGFSQISHTVSGLSAALNTGARNPVRLCVRYMDEKTKNWKPITAISVNAERSVVNNHVLFTGVPTSISGAYVGNMNRGTGGQSVFLGVCRGQGAAPLTRIGVIQIQQEMSPPSCMQVAYSSHGAPAAVNSGNKKKRDIYLLYQNDISGIMAEAKALSADVGVSNKLAGFFAILTASIYCNYAQMVMTSMKMSSLDVLPLKLKLFLFDKIAERVPCYLTAFGPSVRHEIAYYLCETVMRFFTQLPSITMSKMLLGAISLDDPLSVESASGRDSLQQQQQQGEF
eukprot:jgi/Bigna1/132333/aug1.17_g7041